MFKTEYYTKLLMQGEVLISCNYNSNLRGVLETLVDIVNNTEGARFHGSIHEFRRSALRLFGESNFIIALMTYKNYKKLPDYQNIPVSSGKFPGIKKLSFNIFGEVCYVVMLPVELAQKADISVVDIKTHHRTGNRFSTTSSSQRQRIRDIEARDSDSMFFTPSATSMYTNSVYTTTTSASDYLSYTVAHPDANPLYYNTSDWTSVTTAYASDGLRF